jgi:PAS domain S-box-containing protein
MTSPSPQPSLQDSPGLQDSEGRLRLLLDAAPVAILVVNRDGRIVFVNRQMAQTFGYEIGELVGCDVGVLIPESSRRLHPLQVESFFKAAVPRVMGIGREVRAVDRKGREFPVEIGLTPITGGDEPQVMAAIIDITERKRLETESTLARIVQQAMLPQMAPDFAGCDIAGASEPADATGGDFFDYIRLPNDRLAVVIGDASGHGFAAALVTAAARSYLRALSRVEINLSRILPTANRLLIEDVCDGRFVTLMYAVLDPSRSSFTYAGAGHAGYHFGRDGNFKQRLESTGPPLGWFPEAEYPAITAPAESGDLLLLLTDGIEESLSPDGEFFGRDRVEGVIKQRSRESASSIVRALHEAVHKFRGELLPHDDATVIVVKLP